MVALPWSDAPATSSTHIRARHIAELRRTVDRNRRAASLAPVTWTDNPVTSATHIRATHFNEVRSAIPSSVPIGNWSVGTPPSGGRQVSARDINDLRGWVDAWSQSLHLPTGPDPVPQGVTSFTVDENSGPNFVQIDQTWINDILELGPGLTLGGPLNLRADIRATAATNVVPTSAYASAFNPYRQSGIVSTGLLTRQFDIPGGGDNPYSENDPIIGMTNSYIDHFVARAKTVAGQIAADGVGAYIVWNEPNNGTPPTQGALAAQNFAALLYQCYTNLRPMSEISNVYMGGILWPYGQVIGGQTVSAQQASDMVHDYLQAVYNFLLDNRIRSYDGSGTPWDAVNVHVHHCGWQDSDTDYLYARINGVFDPGANPHGDQDGVPDARPQDRKGVIIGEWGITHDEQRTVPNCMANAYTALTKRFDAMWYFQHPIHNPAITPGSCADSGDVFGLIEWSESNVFVAGNRCPEWSTLRSLYETP